MKKTIIPVAAVLLALGINSCDKDKKSEENQEQAQGQFGPTIQTEQKETQHSKPAPCEAFAEVPVYEITVKKGDSLGRFIHNSEAGARFHVKEGTFDEQNCAFTDTIGVRFSNGQDVWSGVKSKYDIIPAAKAVAELNGTTLKQREYLNQEFQMDQANEKLFHKGKKILLPAFELTHTGQVFIKRDTKRLENQGTYVGKMIVTCNPGKFTQYEQARVIYNSRYNPRECFDHKYRFVRGKKR